MSSSPRYEAINAPEKKPRKRNLQKALCIGTAGLILTGLFVGAYFGVNIFVSHEIKENDVLTNGSTLEKEWSSPTTPVYTNFYFFDVQNPDEVLKGAKPRVIQKGPYAYREYKEKLNATWNKNRTEVKYFETDYFLFDRNQSSGDVRTDQVTTLNVILMVLLSIMSHKSKIDQGLFNLALDLVPSEHLFTTRSVYDLIWGYEDSTLKTLHRFDKNIPTKFAFQNNISEPNMSAPSRIHTGVGDLHKLGRYLEYQGMKKLPYWEGEDANTIRGTEGFFFGPGNGKKSLYVFVDQLFRSGYFNFSSYENLHGIDLYRFRIPEFELASATKNPANKVFYSFGPDGICNLTTVVPMNAPVYVSKPHFLGSDPGLIANITGLSPNSVLHDSYFDVEPLSGAVMRAYKRLQMNIKIERDEYLSDLKHIRSMYFPLFWAEETAVASENTTSTLKSKVFTPRAIAYGVVISGIAVSGLMCLAGFSAAVVIRLKRKSNTLLVNDPEVY
eukprot:m.11176 g.11176  ORF g.11176 m.11176 type:complete len:499 (+) comp23057_c0_seq1:265-1761(+)